MDFRPKKGLCEVCNTKHASTEPHNIDSMYYKMLFYKKMDRYPTIEDAMAHCSEEVKNEIQCNQE